MMMPVVYSCIHEFFLILVTNVKNFTKETKKILRMRIPMFCFFVSDLHGKIDKYEKLFNAILKEKPNIVLFGGDLLPHHYHKNFLLDFIQPNLERLKTELAENYPYILVIFGNNDAKIEEKNVISISQKNLWHYLHFRKIEIDNYQFYGYSYTPPSPFLLKDWEKYDVSRNIEADCISLEDGIRTIDISEEEKKYSTIKDDLIKLVKNDSLSESIILFHAPPYQTNLDRIANVLRRINSSSQNFHTHNYRHVGSVAIRKFIEEKQPLLTLHGHIHESARLSNSWKDKIGKTHCFTAAHDGKELAIIKFDMENLENAERILI